MLQSANAERQHSGENSFSESDLGPYSGNEAKGSIHHTLRPSGAAIIAARSSSIRIDCVHGAGLQGIGRLARRGWLARRTHGRGHARRLSGCPARVADLAFSRSVAARHLGNTRLESSGKDCNAGTLRSIYRAGDGTVAGVGASADRQPTCAYVCACGRRCACFHALLRRKCSSIHRVYLRVAVQCEWFGLALCSFAYRARKYHRSGIAASQRAERDDPGRARTAGIHWHTDG